MARLVVINGPDEGREFPLDDLPDGSHVGGRDPRHPFALADATVSREHFRLERLPRGFRLVDLGSRNRTFLNGEPVREGMLRNGDVISAGDSELRFEDDAEVEVADNMASTIVKELDAGSSSIERIIDTLKSDPGLRRERIRHGVDSLRRLFDMSRAMMESASVEGLYQRFLEILVPALEADRGFVMARRGESWAPAAAHPSPSVATAAPGESTSDADTRAETATTTRRAIACPVSQTIINRVVMERTAILSRNAALDDRFESGASIAEGEIGSVLAAPIRAPGREGDRALLGVLYVDRLATRPPFNEDELHLLGAAAEQAGGVICHLESAAGLREANRNLMRTISDARSIIGESPAIQEVHTFIRKAAPTAMTVLIRGETGTGKDLVASAIHHQSPRRGKPFVAINCAALPENLLESELFGHEKGAFTGALGRKKGRFELADGGTVFLDEIAELSPGCQAKVLRLLEERRFERVGGAQPIEVDVRILAATNQDLAAAIEEGRFREDLFYRLNVLAVTLPPLRERAEDIPVLVRYFLSEMGLPEERKVLSAAAERRLLEYHWPGNVRQLRNAVESAVVMREGPVVDADDLVLPARASDRPDEEWRPDSLEEVQRRHILRVLEHTGGNKKRAAEILGIERCTLYARLRSYGVGVKERKERQETRSRR